MSDDEHPPRGWRHFAADCKLVGEALQPIGLMVAAFVALFTYVHSVYNDRDLRERELTRISNEKQSAYYGKQLNLYLDAARTAARLAAIPADPDRDKIVARFWECAR